VGDIPGICRRHHTGTTSMELSFTVEMERECHDSGMECDWAFHVHRVCRHGEDDCDLKRRSSVLRTHESESSAQRFTPRCSAQSRGEAGAASDIDVMWNSMSIGRWDLYAVETLYQRTPRWGGDVVNRRTPALLRDNILRDAIHAF
jgi:hypothetical protein